MCAEWLQPVVVRICAAAASSPCSGIAAAEHLARQTHEVYLWNDCKISGKTKETYAVDSTEKDRQNTETHRQQETQRATERETQRDTERHRARYAERHRERQRESNREGVSTSRHQTSFHRPARNAAQQSG